MLAKPPGRISTISPLPTYKDVALDYWARGYEPIPVKGKRPVPAGSTGKHGTVTEAKIREWMDDPEWADQNVALRASGYIAIDVDHYGPKNGADQLALLESRLGPLPATPSSTSRGVDSPSRQHFFAIREPVEMFGKPPIAGLDANKIHIEIIQAHHRYSVAAPSINPDGDNAPYVWYDADGEPMAEPPLVDEMEYLPEAWLEFLAIGDREFAHSEEQWGGDIPEVASDTEERKLRAIVTSLQSLPDVWEPGVGWHDTVIKAACWLHRIARSNAYALTLDQGLQLILEHAPTYPGWGVENIMQQWDSAAKITHGQFEEPPLESRPPILPWTGFPMDRAFPSINGEAFSALWAGRPEKETPGALWARRHQLLVALLRSGFTEQEAATIVWHSGSNRGTPITFMGQTFEDPEARAISESELWREVDQAIEEINRDNGGTVEAAPENERPSLVQPDRQSFLTEGERKLLLGDMGQWWGTRFIEWAESTFSTVNLPYYRMNRWTVLSVIFAPKATLPRPGGNDRPLNLYQAIVGTTTSGKTEALRVIKHIFKAYFLMADSPDIGGNHTPESLSETLIAKDGLATWFHVDEAHTKIAVWKKPQGPYAEMPGVITDVYDGDVGAIYRATKKDISGKGARAFMTTHLMGTPMGMADVMGPDDWESGFLNRFVWAIGDMPIETLESVAGDWLSEEALDEDTAEVSSGVMMYQQWAAEFAGAVSAVSRADGKAARIRLPQAVIERHRQFAWDLSVLAKQSTYAERLRPTFRRLGETVMRCAALVALSEGRLAMTLADLLIAIEQAEEWVQNIIIMVEATDESLRTREVNMIERAIFSSGGVMPLAALHRLPRFKNRRRDVEDLLGELVAQGRAERGSDTQTKIDIVKTKGVLRNE